LAAASSNVLVSGSDDNYLKVWDRRSLGDSGRHTKPSGVLVGHTEGITYVDPKGDGRFVLSNGKDQVRFSLTHERAWNADEKTALHVDRPVSCGTCA
jgi:WD40 repeat protein